MKELIEKIGTLAKNLPEMHDIEFKVGHSLHNNTFFQKLIPRNILEKGVRVQAHDYFKALVFLDYFTNVIQDDPAVCDNLVKISKALRDEERERGEDKGVSYVNLDTVVLEAAMNAKEKKKDYADDSEAIRKRYENQAVDFARKIDPYYIGIGQMLYDLVSKENKQLLENISSRDELAALVFTDCILSRLKDQAKVKDELSQKDYFKASLIALDGIRKQATLSDLESSIEADKNG